MAIYLREFETQAAYEAAQSGLILPNVSLILEDGGVKYTQGSPTPPTPSHDYVEIGGVKWATMNVGANSITDTGLYFQWGDISGYTASKVGSGSGRKYFGWEDYKYGNGTSKPGATGMTKYNSTDGKTVLDVSDDAVTAAWGGQWRMPTTEEYAALGNAVNTTWTQVDGVYGMLCTDKTDSSKTLFFPACGYCYDGNVYSISGTYSDCDYWSSSLYRNNVQLAHRLLFNDGNVGWQYSDSRCKGFPVRGIMDA